MEFKCNCTNSGTNCFTGACSVCGMSKNSPQESITEKMKELQLINNLKLAVLALPKQHLDIEPKFLLNAEFLLNACSAPTSVYV
jgi:hypothetical protein